MPRSSQHLTLCGIHPRAWVVRADGNRLTYEWPCGYQKTETLRLGPGILRKPAGEPAARFFAGWWSKARGGVSAECPRCRRLARKVSSVHRLVADTSTPSTTTGAGGPVRPPCPPTTAPCTHNAMVEHDDPNHVWACAACGYVYGTGGGSQ